MIGSMTYEVARQRIADQRRAARQAGEAREARERRAAARGRHARKEAPETATPVIPDFVEEMFDNQTGGRHARSGR
jgi:hypothetical protein